MSFREGRAKVKLSGGATLICSNAMLAYKAYGINFCDLQGHEIHALTTIRDGKEILNLMQGEKCLVIPHCQANSIYRGHQGHDSTYLVVIPHKVKLRHDDIGL